MITINSKILGHQYTRKVSTPENIQTWKKLFKL